MLRVVTRLQMLSLGLAIVSVSVFPFERYYRSSDDHHSAACGGDFGLVINRFLLLMISAPIPAITAIARIIRVRIRLVFIMGSGRNQNLPNYRINRMGKSSYSINSKLRQILI